MKILVTGSTGQIGAHVMEAGESRGHNMHGLDLRSTPNLTQTVADIRDSERMRSAASGADAVVHCAAQVSVPRSVADPLSDASVNIQGTINTLMAAAMAGAAFFVNISSAAVYGEPVRLPIDEGHPIRPISPYGVGKAAAEQYVNVLGRIHDLSTCSLRPFNVYSSQSNACRPFPGVIDRFCDRMAQGERPIIFGDGLQTRDFVHASDVARLAVQCCESPPEQSVLNVGTGQPIALNDLVDMVNVALGRNFRPQYEAAQPGDVRHSVSDIRSARQTGWNPEPLDAEKIRVMLTEG